MFGKTSYGVRFETRFFGGESIGMRVIRTGAGQPEKMVAYHSSKSAYYISRLQEKYAAHYRNVVDIHTVVK